MRLQQREGGEERISPLQEAEQGEHGSLSPSSAPRRVWVFPCLVPMQIPQWKHVYPWLSGRDSGTSLELLHMGLAGEETF